MRRGPFARSHITYSASMSRRMQTWVTQIQKIEAWQVSALGAQGLSRQGRPWTHRGTGSTEEE
eukprot:9394998-Prorocentrum_lima.AAC.1